jgi:hypothetical protein
MLGLTNGVVHFVYNEGSPDYDYVPGSFNDGADTVAILREGDSNLHVLRDNGRFHYDFNATTGVYSNDASLAISGGTSIAINSDGVLFVTHATGLSALGYDGEAYSQITLYEFNVEAQPALDVDVDANGVLHVIHNDGLSSFTFNGSAIIPGAFYQFPGGTAVVASPLGEIYSTQQYGLNVWGFTGTEYTPDGFIGFQNAIDLAIDSSNVVHVVHEGGLSSFIWNTGTSNYWTATGYFPFSGGRDVMVDSEDNIHVGHAGGISEFDFVLTNYVDNTEWQWIEGGVNDIIEIFPQAPPPVPVCWIDAQNLYWDSAKNVIYAVDGRETLQSAWQELTNGIAATPSTNSIPLPLDLYDQAFFRVKASK